MFQISHSMGSDELVRQNARQQSVASRIFARERVNQREAAFNGRDLPVSRDQDPVFVCCAVLCMVILGKNPANSGVAGYVTVTDAQVAPHAEYVAVRLLEFVSPKDEATLWA
jgi:hypothetical protein